jgi:hypothetical protein
MGPVSTSDEGRMPKTVRVLVLGLVVGSTGIPCGGAETRTASARGAGLTLRVRNDAQLLSHLLADATGRPRQSIVH